MDPNNLAVNSVISSYPTSSLAEDERFRAAVSLALEECVAIILPNPIMICASKFLRTRTASRFGTGRVFTTNDGGAYECA